MAAEFPTFLTPPGECLEPGDLDARLPADSCLPLTIVREARSELLWLLCLDATGRGSEVLLEFRDDAEDNPENWTLDMVAKGEDDDEFIIGEESPLSRRPTCLP